MSTTITFPPVPHLPVSPEQMARMQAMKDRIDREGDEAIDVSDIPELTHEDFARAVRVGGRPRRTTTGTKPVTARLDQDLITWLKSKGRGYQTRLNAIVREAMERERTGHP